MPRQTRLLLLSLGSVLLGGCGSAQPDTLSVAVIGDARGAFDPMPRLSYAAQLVHAASAEGLVALDEDGRVIPALADRWIITDDGASYIFRLRDGTWPDGSAITGESVRAALAHAFADLHGTALGQDLAGVTDLRAMAGRVVELRLARPMPDFLQVLAQPELGLLHRGRGAGPLALRRSGNAALLTAISPEARGLPALEGGAQRAQPLRLVALSGEQAVADYGAGKVAVVLGGNFADLPRTTRSALGLATARLDPVSGLFGLAVVQTGGMLASPELREALAMAIDRDALAAVVPVSGWLPTTRMVGRGAADDPGMVDERWSGQAMPARQAEAVRRIAHWRKGGKPATLRIALPPGPGADLLFARLAADFAAVGLRAQRVGAAAPADLRLIDTVARYPAMAWFLHQLSCAALAGPCSTAADSATARALAIADPQARAEALAEAEAVLTKANIFIPLGAPIRWSLWSGSGLGLAPNRWGFHTLVPMAIRADTR